MAGNSLGAPSPTSPAPTSTSRRSPPHLVPASTRTRRNHGAFTLGGQLACIYSTRSAGRCYGVSFELGAHTLIVSARMTPGQARAMASALSAAAEAVEIAQGGAA